MPLSEHEQRLLEQMERALYAEDPKFASTLRQNTTAKASGKRLALGVTGVVLGLAVLVAGVATKLAFIGVFGFILMLAGTVYALTGKKDAAAVPDITSGKVPGQTANSNKPRNSGFMDRMEDRWKQRRDGEPDL